MNPMIMAATRNNRIGLRLTQRLFLGISLLLMQYRVCPCQAMDPEIQVNQDRKTGRKRRQRYSLDEIGELFPESCLARLKGYHPRTASGNDYFGGSEIRGNVWGHPIKYVSALLLPFTGTDRP